MNTEDLRERFRQIASGEDERGSFLTAFSKMVCCADLENLRLLRPVMVMMAVKFQLWPGASMHAYNNAKLEQVLVSLVTSQEAEGGFLILLYPKNRAEIIAGLGDAGPDLAETLQKLTNEVKDGNGQPLGKHGHTIARS